MSKLIRLKPPSVTSQPCHDPASALTSSGETDTGAVVQPGAAINRIRRRITRMFGLVSRCGKARAQMPPGVTTDAERSYEAAGGARESVRLTTEAGRRKPVR